MELHSTSISLWTNFNSRLNPRLSCISRGHSLDGALAWHCTILSSFVCPSSFRMAAMLEPVTVVAGVILEEEPLTGAWDEVRAAENRLRNKVRSGWVNIDYEKKNGDWSIYQNYNNWAEKQEAYRFWSVPSLMICPEQKESRNMGNYMRDSKHMTDWETRWLE